MLAHLSKLSLGVTLTTGSLREGHRTLVARGFERVSTREIEEFADYVLCSRIY
jgi:hypothetical protein